MTYSLALVDGDLQPSGSAGYQIVTGTAKMVQDLRNWLLDPQGSDPFNPSYGSSLDSGVGPDGTTTSLIGQNNIAITLSKINTEIQRVILTYQAQQNARLARENSLYGGKSTFAPGELLNRVQNIDLQTYQDVVLAQISLLTQNGQEALIIQPVS